MVMLRVKDMSVTRSEQHICIHVLKCYIEPQKGVKSLCQLKTLKEAGHGGTYLKSQH